MSSLTFSFDIGHSSIGWSVLSSPPIKEVSEIADPSILGCGSVTFPTDDCLASQRRGFRRQRRHIRSTRVRIEHLKRLLEHLGVLTREQLDAMGHPAPFHLAASTLISGEVLSWRELWDVIRWYAHNRGYDGNRRWASDPESEDEDTEKEKAALELMGRHGTETMAETVCALLGVTPGTDPNTSSTLPYKTQNAAFPRPVVRREVRRILEHHIGKLDHLDQAFIDTLMAPDEDDRGDSWKTIAVPDLKLPRRYFGGLLFGQRIPRFDNRIIAACPITGGKVPNKADQVFYAFRWAMLVANIRVDNKPLQAEQRQLLDAAMQGKGRLSEKEITQAVEDITGSTEHNLKATFTIHPDSEKALVLDPATAYAASADTKRSAIHPFWTLLPDDVRRKASGRWKKGRPVTPQWMIHAVGADTPVAGALEEVADTVFAIGQKKKKPPYLTRGHLLRRSFHPERPSGRAPYTKEVMRGVVDFVFSTNRHPSEKGGPIERTAEVLDKEKGRDIDQLTNNHLIRHRLRILLRLAEDLVETYAEGDGAKVSKVVVEVTRDLREFSGLTAKEMARELGGRLGHFKEAVDYLDEHAPHLKVTGSLIRKCRIALDMDWQCPFTGKRYDAVDLPKMSREHIVPYSDRPTNAMYALVLTVPEVNSMKGKRTGRQFIGAHEGQAVDGSPNLDLFTLRQYDTFVNQLDTRGHDDDRKRKIRRKALLRLDKFEEKDHGFTEGSLTQTSHLVRLAARQIEKHLPNIQPHDIISLPGQVTSEIRKHWNLLGCMARAVPEVLDENGKTITKTEIRDLTHLHHAVDAATIALGAHYIPNRGSIWEAIIKRRKEPKDWALLRALGVFKRNTEGRVELTSLPDSVKDELGERLAEERVVQHIPSDMSGVVAEQNTWRVVSQHSADDDPSTLVTLRQRSSEVGTNGERIYKKKEKKERLGKLLGVSPVGGEGKLKEIKGALIISDNYGLALDPEPAIIPFHKVWHRLQTLRKANGGNPVRILRNGMLIRVLKNSARAKQDYTGLWRIVSLKNNKSGLALDIIRPSYVKAQNRVAWSGMNMQLATMLSNGLEIVEPTLCGSGATDKIS